MESGTHQSLPAAFASGESSDGTGGMGVLVIEETGDRKWGNKTSHIGRQWLGSLGKTGNGVVSVSSLWAEERVCYPLEVEPNNLASYFARGKAAPVFRIKPQSALELGQTRHGLGAAVSRGGRQ